MPRTKPENYFPQKTDLKNVKRYSVALLHVGIKKGPRSPLIVSHPFTSYGHFYQIQDGKPVFLQLDNEEGYQTWLELMTDNIEKTTTASKIYDYVTTPYKLTFLKYVRPYLSRTTFSKLLRDAWISEEFANMDVNVNQSERAKFFKLADAAFLMNSAERKTLDAMPETVTVYRGVTAYNAKNVKTMSWTSEKSVASWFSTRFNTPGVIYRATIQKQHILAYLSGRNESEVIVDPRYLDGIARI